MFFYVDESGHTGNRLFDENQPTLYYGLLSSRINLDLLASPYLDALKDKLNLDELHAADLSNGKLAVIIPVILELNKKYGLVFDFYKVVKADYVLICFFDQVFDSGVNPAVSWTVYSTPMRYAMILKLSEFFDNETLKTAWSARIELDQEKSNQQLITVCKTIKDRVNKSSDERLKEVVGDALQWAQDHPTEIGYNVGGEDQILQSAPNLIGFQLVLFGIASRLLKQKRQASKIIVDHQLQFNAAQQTLADYYMQFPNDKPIEMGLGLPELDLKGMPNIPITNLSSETSPGLQLVDIFLWVFKRRAENRQLTDPLIQLINSQIARGSTDEVSLAGIYQRWSDWYYNKPDVSDSDLELAKVRLRAEEERRVKAVNEGLRKKS